MDGLMYGRRNHASHGSYHGSRRQAEGPPPAFPMPSLYGSRDMYRDDVRGHHSTTPSSASRLAGNATSPTWDHRQSGLSNHQSSSMHSSAYSSYDGNRPSLPSLRTILGENARSPTAVSHHNEASFQVLPKKPVYDQSTYKPPSLYPNKRTRTDSGWDGQDDDRKLTEQSLTTLPFMNTRHEDRSQPQLELPTLNNSSPDAYRHRHADRNHALLNHYGSPEERGRSTHLQASPRLSLTQNVDLQSRTRGHYHPLSRSESSHMEGILPNGYDSVAVNISRSPSTSLPDDSTNKASIYGHPGATHHAYGSDVLRHSLVPAGHNSGYTDDYTTLTHPDGPHGYNGPPYPYPQAFFVPSHYEYQNGKSRKRSNLPKQSTEIMKRWFDDNLQNPYPSEEQKRHFAAVAGINLTQVSNWFINHRRRCPELREKRDKGRSRSRDESI